MLLVFVFEVVVIEAVGRFTVVFVVSLVSLVRLRVGEIK